MEEWKIVFAPTVTSIKVGERQIALGVTPNDEDRKRFILMQKAPEMLEMLKYLAKNEHRKHIYEKIEQLIKESTTIEK